MSKSLWQDIWFWNLHQEEDVNIKIHLPTYHFHVDSLFGELPVHDELHLVVLELILQGGHVVAVLGAVLGQSRHLPPSQLLESRDIGVSGKLNLSSITFLVDPDICDLRSRFVLSWFIAFIVAPQSVVSADAATNNKSPNVKSREIINRSQFCHFLPVFVLFYLYCCFRAHNNVQKSRTDTFEILFSKSSVWFLDSVEFPQLCKVPHFVTVICKVLESILLSNYKYFLYC